MVIAISNDINEYDKLASSAMEIFENYDDETFSKSTENLVTQFSTLTLSQHFIGIPMTNTIKIMQKEITR